MEPKQRKLSIGYLALALIAMVVLQLPLFAPRAAGISYSEFKALVKKGKVSDLTLDKQTIRGTLSTDGLETLLPKEKIEELKRSGGGPHPFVADRLDVLLGGRVAEELVFGDISTGAQDDLQRATDMARHMVARYGMSEALGLATFEPPRQALFLNVPSIAQREYSEETARRIDDEIQKLLETSHGRVLQTLTARRAVLTSLAKRLIEKEVVGRDGLVALLKSTAA